MQKEFYNLTNPQKSIWVLEQFYKNTPVNNICGTVIINEPVNFNNLIKAIKIFIETNDSFKIKLHFDKNNEIKQYFSDSYDIDSSNIVSLESTKELEAIQEDLVNIPFSLIDSQLFKLKLFKFSKNGHGGFVLNIHHLIGDACTAGLVASKIINIYTSLQKNEDITEPSTSYINYIESEKEYLSSSKFEKDKEYWENNFASLPDIASLSTVNLNAVSSCDCKSNRKLFILDNKKVEEINTYCKDNNISIFNFFMAIFGIYIGKVKNLKHFVLGTPILNRTTYTEKHTPGMFISTVPFYFNMEQNMSFKDFSSLIAMQTIGMFRHQKYPYQEILEQIRKQDSSIPNLYNVMISYQNTRTNKQSSEIDYDVIWTHSNYTCDELDIHLFDMNDLGSLNIAYDYQTSKYSLEDINDIHHRVINIIDQILYAKKNIFINEIELITLDEKENILTKYNNNIQPKITKTVIDLFNEQVQKTPNKTAICYNNISLTYTELNKLVNKLCSYLIQNGLKNKDKVCLFLNNSIDLVASILAVLKCGACYIPIDVTYPIERVEYIVHNSDCKLILTNEKNIHKLNFLANISLLVDYNKINNLPSTNINYNFSALNSLAYIIYTSGSTGNPKGVKIAHESLSNYICWASKVYVQGKECNFPLYSSISFDLTVTSIYTPLISGNAIYIYENSNPQLLLKQIIDDKNVHIIKLTPAHLALLIDCIIPNSLISKLIVGGDILSNEICRKLTSLFDHKISIFNEYGPTEATVGCMIYEYNKEDNKKYASVPIGIPADNVKLYVLNDDLNLVPFNQPGELYISGKCLSKGYVKLRKTTAERFLPSPFNKKEKLYKTGDIVKLYKNNIMEYIGRSDFQVKINGYRIEIGEIQSRILDYPNIKDCFIDVCKKDNSKVLCAYYVCDKNKPINLKYLKDYLVKSLPSYMVPKYYVLLDKIPLTGNGKVDKKLLPPPTNSGYDVYVKPEGKLENLLCDIFSSLLNIDKISVTANIFDYYVDSLVIIKAQTMLYSHGIDINTQHFYEYPSIRSLASFISSPKKEDSSIAKDNIPSTIDSFVKPFLNAPTTYDNILLFGATGFLGIHILYSLLKTTSSHIYCVIREKNNLDAVSRFYNKIKFYFNAEDFKEYENRITTITGNILKDDFGLTYKQYEDLGNKIDCVISSAAIVKHYGNYDEFYETNVTGTNRIVNFCSRFKIPFHYISTMSVSGYGLVETPECTFSENDFYVGQHYQDNVYVNSKFEAEKLILKACKEDGLISSIYRIGNITNRYTDGMFQQNAEDSAFLNRIISIINLGIIPKELLNLPLEFTPVDYCANFIVKLLNVTPNNINIYHLYNQNSIILSNLINILKENNIDIQISSINEFENKILLYPDKYFGITNYIANIKNSNLNNIKLSNDFTNDILRKNSLKWPLLDNTYFYKILKYLTKYKFIGDANETNNL